MPKIQKHLNQFYKTRAFLAALALIILVSGAAAVHADQFAVQINALQQQNSAARGTLSGLTSQASSYQQVINQLQTQINDIQSKISANEAQQAELQTKIAEAKAKIALQKKYLGQDIKAMYIDGQLTTIEELATSKNLSEYVDKQEYRIAVQKKLDITIKQIAVMQAELQKQKAELDNLIDSQKQQNDQLASAQGQQQNLLSYNQGQQDAFNQQINTNSSKIGELRRQQAVLNARYNVGDFKGDPGNGGYPSAWANAPQDSLIDSWGMYNRECVSYTAFKVHQDYLAGRNNRDMPYWGGIGNANQWDDNASA
ncbi:MAG: hypothetical protein AAB971_01705, partial [Patescibacteria group bacterium]